MALDPLTAGLDVVNNLIERFFPNKDQQEQYKAQALQMAQTGELQQLLGQLAINQEEAKSTIWFVAGWRPFVGWSCGFALSYATIIEPLMRFISTTYYHYMGTFPVLDTSLTNTVLMGMLGLGAMRTYEKVQGAESKR
jgi:hypothetical protein